MVGREAPAPGPPAAVLALGKPTVVWLSLVLINVPSKTSLGLGLEVRGRGSEHFVREAALPQVHLAAPAPPTAISERPDQPLGPFIETTHSTAFETDSVDRLNPRRLRS